VTDQRSESTATTSSSSEPVNGRLLLAVNLRRLRGDRRLSQEGLADRAGIHRTYVGSVERAERNIAVDNICRLAWALGVDVRELLSPVRMPARQYAAAGRRRAVLKVSEPATGPARRRRARLRGSARA
jgi:transcriptional regulator with XRE-family HTH domain